jgi:hypothetical protein
MVTSVTIGVTVTVALLWLPSMSETCIRDLAGIITRNFCGIKNVNFATLLLSSEAEAAREQVHALTFEKPISIGLSTHLQRPFTSPL